MKIDDESSNNWRTASRYWKLGIFYFNKNDKRIFPPKKPFYGGWTVNFANPISMVVNFGILAFIIGIILFINSKVGPNPQPNYKGGVKVENIKR